MFSHAGLLFDVRKGKTNTTTIYTNNPSSLDPRVATLKKRSQKQMIYSKKVTSSTCPPDAISSATGNPLETGKTTVQGWNLSYDLRLQLEKQRKRKY